VKRQLEALGSDPVASKPEEFAARINVEVPRWAKVIREANISVK
jgi:tripartite-type tricarboxylate transporter receptor subunit TctC